MSRVSKYYDGWRWRHMISLACLIDVSVVLVVPYFYPVDRRPLLLSLALDFNKHRDL
jgi:hypothetical protein